MHSNGIWIYEQKNAEDLYGVLNDVFDQFSLCIETIVYHYGWTVEEVLQVSLVSITRVVSKFSMNNLDLESPCKTVQSISGGLLYFFIFNDVIKKRSSELVSIQLHHQHVYLHFTL